MDYIVLQSSAKINLALDILGKFPNGYHEMKMIMQTLSLRDNLYIKKTNDNKILLKTNSEEIPVNSDNLVCRAARYMTLNYDIPKGLYVELEKNIPVSAGLAGGSGNCAKTLVGIRDLYELPISDEKLMEIGVQFGADVPYCIMEGTVLAEGIGDKLTKISAHPQVFVLLATPSFAVSTTSVFGKFNIENIVKKPDVDLIIDLIKQNDIVGIGNNLCNVLESVTARKYAEINDMKNIMLQNGAVGSCMSGSGPTVFGYFEKEDDGILALEKIRYYDKSIKELHLVSIYNK